MSVSDLPSNPTVGQETQYKGIKLVYTTGGWTVVDFEDTVNDRDTDRVDAYDEIVVKIRRGDLAYADISAANEAWPVDDRPVGLTVHLADLTIWQWNGVDWVEFVGGGGGFAEILWYETLADAQTAVPSPTFGTMLFTGQTNPIPYQVYQYRYGDWEYWPFKSQGTEGQFLQKNGVPFYQNSWVDFPKVQEFNNLLINGALEPSSDGYQLEWNDNGTYVRTDENIGIFQDTFIAYQRDENIQSIIDPLATYTLSTQFKSGTVGKTSVIGRRVFSKDHILMRRGMNQGAGLLNTVTTLAADLNPGDTTVTLTSAAGWDAGSSVNAGFIWGPAYTDSQGYTFPFDNTDKMFVGTQYLAYYSNFPYVSIAANVITLFSNWIGPLIPAGTVIANTYNGDNNFNDIYQYGVYGQASNTSVTTTDWEEATSVTSLADNPFGGIYQTVMINPNIDSPPYDTDVRNIMLRRTVDERDISNTAAIPGSAVVAASETDRGTVELATSAEVAAGSSNSVVITPEALDDSGIVPKAFIIELDWGAIPNMEPVVYDYGDPALITGYVFVSPYNDSTDLVHAGQFEWDGFSISGEYLGPYSYRIRAVPTTGPVAGIYKFAVAAIRQG